MTWQTWAGANTTSTVGTFTYLARPQFVDPDAPVLVGDGDPDFSTCTDLETTDPVLCWDVNGYYRDLGVHWRATKKELFIAYRDDGGPDNARLTYVFKQLINPVIRRKYDKAPFGSRFVDKYVAEEIIREMKRQMAAAGMDTADDDNIRRVAKHFGLETEPEDDTPEGDPVEEIDKDPSQDEDVSDPPEILAAAPPFSYPFYLWRSRCDDRERLGLWQSMLVQAFSQKGVKRRLSVGYLGRMAHSWSHMTVGRRLVVFLNENHEPTPEMAEAVADLIKTTK